MYIVVQVLSPKCGCLKKQPRSSLNPIFFEQKLLVFLVAVVSEAEALYMIIDLIFVRLQKLHEYIAALVLWGI